MCHIVKEDLLHKQDVLMKDAELREDQECAECSRARFFQSFSAFPRSHPTVEELAELNAIENRQKVKDPTTLIIIDEADRLKMPGLEQVRDIFDRGGIGVVLIGMRGLEKRLAVLPAVLLARGLRPRIPIPRRKRSARPAEPRMDASGGGASQQRGVRRGGAGGHSRITDGNFRLLERLLTQMGGVLEINNLPQVTRAVVEVARESLVIGTA